MKNVILPFDFGVKYDPGIFLRFNQIVLQKKSQASEILDPKCLNPTERKKKHPRAAKKNLHTLFTSCSCSGGAFTHIFTCCEIMPLFIFSSLQVFVYYATAVYYTTLSEQLSSDLCFPAERIHYSEGAIEQTMPKHTTHTEEDTKGNLASSDIMDDICSQKMQPFYGRWKQFVVFSWKSHSDSRRYFALY